MPDPQQVHPAVLFVGGCHVYAYGVEERLGFVPSTLELIASHGIHPNSKTLAPVSAKQRQRIADEIAKCAPDVLVLQLGHWESMQSLSIPACSRSVSDHLKSPVRSIFPREWYWTVKSVHDRIWPRTHIDHALLRRQYQELFADIAAAKVPAVFVLEPFPALDPVVRKYRKVVADIIFEQARSAQLGTIAVTPAFSRPGRPPVRPEYFQRDGLHLSAEGHAAVARLVVQSLMESDSLKRHVHTAA